MPVSGAASCRIRQGLGFAVNINIINLTAANNNGFKISGAATGDVIGRAHPPHRH
jgi:hypothetical protein